MNEPSVRKRLTEEDLKESGWLPQYSRAGHPLQWFHWRVRDGLPLSFEAARRAEETRRKADGG